MGARLRKYDTVHNVRRPKDLRTEVSEGDLYQPRAERGPKVRWNAPLFFPTSTATTLAAIIDAILIDITPPPEGVRRTGASTPNPRRNRMDPF
jgi:hypothetical protein